MDQLPPTVPRHQAVRAVSARALWLRAYADADAFPIDRVVQVADFVAAELGIAAPEPINVGDPLDASVIEKLRETVVGISPVELGSLVADLCSLGDPFGEHLTTPAINALLVEVANDWVRSNPGKQEVVLYDPVCGVGSSLVEAARALREAGMVPRVLGCDINPVAAHLAGLNLAFNDFAADIRVGNCLTSEVEVLADIVIAQPPLGMSWDSSADRVQELESRGRYPFGLPQRSDATWLFASHIVSSLRPGGVGATFAAPLALVREPDRGRRGLVVNGHVRAVALLADRILLNTGIPLAAVVLQHAKLSDGEVTFIDLRALFEDVEDKRSPRAISPQGLETFVSGVSRPRNAKYVRRQSIEDCLTPRVTLHVEGIEESWAVRLDGSASGPIDELLRRRYGPAAGLLSITSQRDVCVLSLAQAFGVEERLTRDLARRGWVVTRLSALLTAPPEVRPEGDARPRDWDGWLVLDRRGRSARVGVSPDLGSGGLEIALPVAAELADVEYLAAWLSTSRAVPLAKELDSHRGLGALGLAPALSEPVRLRAIDDVLVMLPEARARQRGIVQTTRQIARAEAWIDSMREQVWEQAAGPQDGVRKLDVLLDTSVASWASGLPFPVASAVNALRIAGEPYERHRQLFNVWEAYMAFLATVLLSAIQADPARRERVIEQIRGDLTRTGLDYHLASLGTWLSIARICSSEFRRSLSSEDSDAVAQVEELFGGARSQSLMRIMSTDVMQELERVSSWRNSWHGHGGAIGRREVTEQCDQLYERLQAVQSLVGDSWDDLLLVRAGRMSGLPSGEVRLDVEVCRGYSPPFDAEQIVIPGTVAEGGLYLIGRNPSRPVPLLGLVQLRQAPDEVKYTAYFFNRAEPQGSRLVTYQYEAEHDTRVEADLASLILPPGTA